jgi:hypothetical protein
MRLAPTKARVQDGAYHTGIPNVWLQTRAAQLAHDSTREEGCGRWPLSYALRALTEGTY